MIELEGLLQLSYMFGTLTWLRFGAVNLSVSFDARSWRLYHRL